MFAKIGKTPLASALPPAKKSVTLSFATVQEELSKILIGSSFAKLNPVSISSSLREVKLHSLKAIKSSLPWKNISIRPAFCSLSSPLEVILL